MKKIVGDILKDKNIEENLKVYHKKYKEICNQYSLVRFAINYYTYYTMVSEDEGMLEYGNKEYIDEINEAVSNLVSGAELASNINVLENMRQSIVNNMQDLTLFVDRFNIYEYALNRVEYRFKDDQMPVFNDEMLTRKLMQFIFEDEDSVTVNNKISQIMGQIPVRLTKGKFFEMVSNGLSIYKGGTKESLKNFLYMLRTSAMLSDNDSMKDNFPYISEVFEEFEAIDFKTIDKSKYEEMSKLLVKTSEYIDDLVSVNMTLQALINDLLSVMYTYDCKNDQTSTVTCTDIIKETNLLFTGKFAHKSLDEIEEMFVQLEGIQEEIYPLLSSYDVTEQIKECYSDKIEELGLADEYQVVYKLPKLNSDSIFAELELVEDDDVVDETYLEAEKEKLFIEYENVFVNSDKMIRKAIMSATLSELPVFFNNISELQDFVFNNLTLCTDKAEKMACVEIFNQIMEA